MRWAYNKHGQKKRDQLKVEIDDLVKRCDGSNGEADDSGLKGPGFRP